MSLGARVAAAGPPGPRGRWHDLDRHIPRDLDARIRRELDQALREWPPKTQRALEQLEKRLDRIEQELKKLRDKINRKVGGDEKRKSKKR